MSTAEPTRETERTEVVDTLRGFALFGICVINLTAFALPGELPGHYAGGTVLDRVISAAILFLVESKFFTLFSFLFGLGFAFQLRRAERAGSGLGWRYLRRLFFLGLFGVAHIVLLWEGDILLLYAVVGTLLLLFRWLTPRWLVVWAAVLLAVPLLLYALLFGLVALARVSPEGAAALQQADEELTKAMTQERERVDRVAAGSYGEQVAARLRSYAGVAILLATRVPTVLAMFLLGLYAGRLGVLARPADHLPLLRGVRAWGLGLGLPVAGLVTAGYFLLPPIDGLMALLFNQALAGPLLALGYGASLTLLCQDPAWQRRLAPVSAVGRMALTNYLTQSVVCAVLFQHLGLAGKVSPTGQLGLSLAIYAAQMAFSVLWLRAFQYGPMEWLWRSLTYRAWQPLRRRGP